MRQAVLDLEESMIRQVANAGLGRSHVGGSHYTQNKALDR